MAIPFYNQGDQEIYESGNRFIPQQQYRLGYPNTPPPSIANASTGITNTQVAAPYKWPPQGVVGEGGGGGGGGSGNKFGLNMDTLKTIDQGKWQEAGGPANMYPGMNIKTSRDIAQTEGGIWKDVNTGQNVYHGGFNVETPMTMLLNKLTGKTTTGDPNKGTWTGTEWEEDFDPTIAGRKLNTFQRWKAKKEFKAAQEQQAAADQARADVAAAKPSLRAQSAENRAANTGGWQSGMAADEGFMSGEGTSDEMGSFAQGGRIGYGLGDIVKGWFSGGPESETNPTLFGTQNSLMNKTAIIDLEKAIGLYETQIENADQLGQLSEEQQLDYELKLKQLEALIAGAGGNKAQGGLIGYFDGGIAGLL